MKKIFYLLCILTGLGACRQNEEMRFEGEDAVYFQVANYWKTQDSVVYTFAGKTLEVDTIKLQVNLEGSLSEQDRKFSIVVDKDLTTAEVGLHYEALREEYILPAKQVQAIVPIVIHKKDPALDNKKVVLGLRLQPTEDLKLGVTERTGVRIIFSNTLTKPYYWDTYIHYHFGTYYSRKKHELCIQILGKDFPEQQSDYTKNPDYSTWKVYGAYMSNYFEENYPIYDENNVAIEPW